MTYRPRARCQDCGIPRGLAGGLSRNGLCQPCGEARLAENLIGLATKSGLAWAKYRDGMTDYVSRLWGGTVPDYPPEANSVQLSLMEMD